MFQPKALGKKPYSLGAFSHSHICRKLVQSRKQQGSDKGCLEEEEEKKILHKMFSQFMNALLSFHNEINPVCASLPNSNEV